MLKKSLFAVALVAMVAVMAQAGEIKIHDWPTTTNWDKEIITTVPVVMDVGYWVKIKDQDKLKIKMAQNNVDEFEGCDNMTVQCNFDLNLYASIASNGEVGGSYSTYFQESTTATQPVNAGQTTVHICAKLHDAKLLDTIVTSELQVATITISVTPQ
jgi:hypothetical protein